MIARIVTFCVLFFICIVVYADQIPASDFARLPAFSNPQISPQGKFLAATIIYEGKPLLVIQNFSDIKDKQPAVAIPFEGVHILDYQWENEERLIVTVRITHKSGRWNYNISRLISVSRDGKDIKDIEVGFSNRHGWQLPNPNVVDWLDTDSGHILAVLERRIDDKTHDFNLISDKNPYLLHKVNVNTGEKVIVDRNPMGFSRWVVDNEGNVRVGVKYAGGSGALVKSYYRKTPNAEWTPLQKLKFLDGNRLMPWFFDENDNNILIVTSENLEDEDYSKGQMDLHRYDLTKGEVVGLYEDLVFTPIEKAIQKKFPGCRISEVSRTFANDQFTIAIYSDVMPLSYFHFNTKTKNLAFMAEQFPQLNNKKLASMKEVSYVARDQLKIPAYLTVPLGSDLKKLPLIVMPHDGPWSRDVWEFNNYVQFFASRGYAVLQPQFRGSTGFGNQLREAGYKQWGYGIQDDITDGINWAIDQGIADRDRVCIIGTGFGGYAAAMGLISTPDLFQCAISINGVMDMSNFYQSMVYGVNREITNSKWGIKKVSPYHRANEIKKPLLLIAGKKNSWINFEENSLRMYKKLKKLNSPVEYLELQEGEHWRTHEDSQIKILEAIDVFLQKNMAINNRN